MIKQPIILGRLSAWLHQWKEYGSPQKNYLFRSLLIGIACLFSVPLSIIEHTRYSKKILKTKISLPPIFIIGFWRSGTTFLQNILQNDKSIGMLCAWQVAGPGFYISFEPYLKYFLKKLLPENRPMDNVELSFNTPQEEELALLNVTPYSLYYQMFFPKNAPDIFKKYCLLHGLTKSEQACMKNAYYHLVQKLSLYHKGKQLILKNPANTARISWLLEMFPGARFIYMYRNPYDIFVSCLHLFKTLIPYCQLQDIDENNLEPYILMMYTNIMNVYFEQRQKIPVQDLLEIKFEDFEQRPLLWIKKIYDQFHIPGFDNAQSDIILYCQSQRHYKKNTYSFDDKTRIRINEQWGSIINKSGYTDDYRWKNNPSYLNFGGENK
jgi:hypothetical protein